MRAHKLKTWPQYFGAVRDGVKNFEVRKADRDFREGDFLCLVEFDPRRESLTGKYEYRRITYVLTSADAPRGLVDGFVVLSLESVDCVDIQRLQGTYTGILTDPVEWLAPLPAAA